MGVMRDVMRIKTPMEKKLIYMTDDSNTQNDRQCLLINDNNYEIIKERPGGALKTRSGVL